MRKKRGRPRKIPTDPIELEKYHARERAEQLALEDFIEKMKAVGDEPSSGFVGWRRN